MEIWQLWLDTIRGLLEILSADAGLGLGFGVLTLTLLLRSGLLPFSWPAAYRAAIRQKKLVRLAPELAHLKTELAQRPHAYAEALMALYRKNGIAPFDGRGASAAFAQMPLFLGMFQVLRDAGEGARFLWITNLGKPDAWLAAVAALTTALMMLANPDLPEQVRVVLIVVPSIIAAIVALKFCSALAVYWVASNCFSAAQTALVHLVLARRIRSGAVQI
jgi:YidC/Oxa1 family membrane protein insertase